jgi:tripeptidyl-peptidase-1
MHYKSLLSALALAGAVAALTENGWTSVGEAQDDTPLLVHIVMQQPGRHAILDRLMQISDPDSPDYGVQLSSDEVTKMLAVPDETRRWMSRELDTHGGTHAWNQHGDIVEWNTTVGAVEKVVGVQYHVFARDQRRITRCASLPAMNGIWASTVALLEPCRRFPTHPEGIRARVATASNNQITPQVLRSLYKVGDATVQSKKTSQVVTGYLEQYINQQDLQTFFSNFVPSMKGQKANEVGPNDASQPGLEASLDIQYLMGMTQGGDSTFWYTSGRQPHNAENEPFLKFLYDVGNLTDDQLPSVISTSYGDDEGGVDHAYAETVSTEFVKLGARRVSLLFSSGDGGVAGSQPSACTKFIPTFPAASPYVTAVGGTNGASTESGADLSAGGFSNYWSRPTWQNDAVTAYFKHAKSSLPDPSRYNADGAGFPDVAAAALGFLIVVDGNTMPVDGTSCSSPTFAGIVALLNDLRAANGKTPLGYLNPVIYKNADAFNDVVDGHNPGCGVDGFTCAEGWDPVTGLGSPNFDLLAKLAMALP